MKAQLQCMDCFLLVIFRFRFLVVSYATRGMVSWNVQMTREELAVAQCGSVAVCQWQPLHTSEQLVLGQQDVANSTQPPAQHQPTSKIILTVQS